MATKLQNLLSLVFFSAIIHHLIPATSQVCPYPCNPPPIAPGDNPIVGTTPPVSTTPPATFSPPFSTNPPATTGYVPFTPPSPFYYGVAPPPPEPMVPWFPFYYRKPPHQDQSSSLSIKESRNNSLVFLLLFASSLFCIPLIMS